MSGMTESNAQGVKGFLLWNPFGKEYFFRVYSPDGPGYKDYRLDAEDIKVEITCPHLSLYEGAERGLNKLDYSSTVLGKTSKAS